MQLSLFNVDVLLIQEVVIVVLIFVHDVRVLRNRVRLRVVRVAGAVLRVGRTVLGKAVAVLGAAVGTLLCGGKVVRRGHLLAHSVHGILFHLRVVIFLFRVEHQNALFINGLSRLGLCARWGSLELSHGGRAHHALLLRLLLCLGLVWQRSNLVMTARDSL